jgi:Ger(x)C family germination protein
MKKSLLISFFIMICLSGCGKIELNNAAIPTAFGTDFQDNRIVIATQIAKPVSPGTSAGNGPQFSVITASGRTFSEASRNTSLSFAAVPLWSQVQVSLMSDTMAKRGIADQIDFLIRNRIVRKRNTLVVTKNTTPQQVLSIVAYLETYTGMAIMKLIKNQESQLGIYTQTDLNEFLQKLTEPGIEPVVPMISIQKNGREKQLLLQDTAVFKGSKMIGSLNETESRGYSLLNPDKKTLGLFLVSSRSTRNKRLHLKSLLCRARFGP